MPENKFNCAFFSFPPTFLPLERLICHKRNMVDCDNKNMIMIFLQELRRGLTYILIALYGFLDIF